MHCVSWYRFVLASQILGGCGGRGGGGEDRYMHLCVASIFCWFPITAMDA